MREDLSIIRAQADALSAEARRILARAGASANAHPGSASRRRSGPGENFWQYRAYEKGDGAGAIDWRRSARGDRLYVRETELETARNFLFWVDPSASFHWRSDENLSTKAGRAAAILLALATLLAQSGEKCGTLGGPRKPISGALASQRLGEDLWGFTEDAAFPLPNRAASSVIIASDFYDSMLLWKERLMPLAQTNRTGALLVVSDPVEEDFPFEGRVKLQKPGANDLKLVGRAETIQAEYRAKFAARRSELKKLAQSIGWRLVVHSTKDMPGPALAALAQLAEEAR